MFKYPYLDFSRLNEEMNQNQLKSSEKLRYMYTVMQGAFHDREKQLMTGACAAIVAIGGFPIEVKDDRVYILGRELGEETLSEQFIQTIGISTFMSYLNPHNKTLAQMGQTALDNSHLSVLHTLSMSIFVAGISTGVEQELSSQRDIVHLSRLTVAKTKAQDNPCLILRDSKNIEAYKKVLEFTKLHCADIEDRETRNLLFSTAKASCVVLTATLKNFLTLVALKDAGGKEHELVELLLKIEKLLPKFQKTDIGV